MLSKPIVRVADPDLFTSNALFGQPGLYPDASPMSPATGAPMDARGALDLVGSLGPAALRAWEDPDLARRAPEPGVRAAVAALSVTVAAPLLRSFLSGGSPVRSLSLGDPAEPGRVVGPTDAGDPSDRVVNQRYAAEHPLLVAASIAHDLAWSGPGANHSEETLLHLVVALVHTSFVSEYPNIALEGTELSRRQNSLALPLLCSHQPGSHVLTPVAADGAGTAPGGDPAMSTPDFWSIPFGARGPATPMPTAVAEIVDVVCESNRVAGEPPMYDEQLGQRMSGPGLGGALSLGDHLRACLTLGLVNPQDLAAGAGIDLEQLGQAAGVSDVIACVAGR